MNKKTKDEIIKNVLKGISIPLALTIVGRYGLKNALKSSDDVIFDYSISDTQLEDNGVLSDRPLSYLESDVQRNAFKDLDNFQNHFNNTLAPSVYNGKHQLFLTSEQLASFYVMVNSDTYTKETLYDMFGSKVSDSKDIMDKYLEVATIMWEYYSNAIEPSTISSLFQSKENRELVDAFEKLVIKYNKLEHEEDKAIVSNEIVSMLNGLAENDNDLNIEAVSYIFVTGLPFAQANRMFVDNNDLYQMLLSKNEKITIDGLYKEVVSFDKYAKEVESNEENIENNLNVSNSVPITREEAVRLVGEEAVREAEKKAFEELQDYVDDAYEDAKAYADPITREEAVRLVGEEAVRETEKKAFEELQDYVDDAYEDAKAYADAYNSGYQEGYQDGHKR